LNQLIAHGSERKDSHLDPPNHHSHHCRLAVHKPSTDPFCRDEISLVNPNANRGSWVVLEVSGYGKVFLAFSIANLTYPRTTLPTSYSIIVSKVNETALPAYIRGFTVKLTALHVQDSYDGSTSSWARSELPDAVQATALFNFQTSANHQLKFTISYQLYEVLFIGSLVDHSATHSFNITQNVV
jgi:hypothetical protein